MPLRREAKKKRWDVNDPPAGSDEDGNRTNGRNGEGSLAPYYSDVGRMVVGSRGGSGSWEDEGEQRRGGSRWDAAGHGPDPSPHLNRVRDSDRGGGEEQGLPSPPYCRGDSYGEEEEEDQGRFRDQEGRGRGGSAREGPRGVGGGGGAGPQSHINGGDDDYGGGSLRLSSSRDDLRESCMDVPVMLRRSRLCLVLDLDHTLVNSALFSEVEPEAERLLAQRLATEGSSGGGGQQQELYKLDRLGMWTKLRPGVRDFLRRAHDRYELWIHTHGNRQYADVIAELLDPRGVYFGGRIVALESVPLSSSSGELGPGEDAAAAEQQLIKRLVAGLEGREPIAVILDDSSAVWPHDARNLFVVERYIYFPSSRRRFGLPGPSLLEAGRDECPSQGMLPAAGQVLERIHDTLFTCLHQPGLATQILPSADPKLQPWDVRNVMEEERRKVLSGCVLVFSRVIPLGLDPKEHALWRLAELFGAECSTVCTESTTHVVANSRGTEKTFWASQNHRHVVSTAWLECSCVLWSRALEGRFAVPVPVPTSTDNGPQ